MTTMTGNETNKEQSRTSRRLPSVNRAMILRAAIVAAVIGGILTLINQPGWVAGSAPADILPLALAFLIPFGVVLISQVAGTRRAFIDTVGRAGPAIREGFITTTFSHGIPARAAAIGLVFGSLNAIITLLDALAQSGDLAAVTVAPLGQAYVLPLVFGLLSQSISYRRSRYWNTIPDHRRHDMGRWRPPAPESSPYITPAGFAALRKELDDIWLRRRDVVKALAAAAAEGDRSENAEYIYRKKELGGLDRRIRYLQKRLPVLNVVRESPNDDAIYFGATVEVCDDAGETQTYRIVGADETDAKTSAISMDSPLARSLLAKRVDDEIVVTIGDKTTTMNVLSIRYEAMME